MKSVGTDVSEERGASIFRVKLGEESGHVFYLEDRGSSFLRNSVPLSTELQDVLSHKKNAHSSDCRVTVFTNILEPCALRPVCDVALRMSKNLNASTGSCVVFRKFERNQ